MFKVIFILVFLFCAAARADVAKLKEDLIAALSQQYPTAVIELKGEPVLIQGHSIDQHHRVNFLSDDAKGTAYFMVDQSQVKVGFSAWLNAVVAVRKISPKQKLHNIHFADKKINIAVGNERQYRGLYYSDRKNLNKLETRTTILPGQYLLSTAIQKIPDIRRGDVVQMKLIGDGITLTTSATAQESGINGESIIITTQKGKKQHKGVLVDRTTVEVSL